MKRFILLTLVLAFVKISFAQWTTSGTNISNSNTGNVGIGTTAPGYKFDVNGYIHTNTAFVADAQAAGNIIGWFRGSATGSGNVVLQGSAGAAAAYWFSANQYLKIGGTGGTEPSVGAININTSGNVGIGTLTPGSFKLAVEGSLGARSIRVTLTNPWPDYVFNKQYKLRDLLSLEHYIKLYNHLPGIPNETEVKNDGVDLGQMNAKLLEKVEELTLYIIELKKENDQIKNDLKKLSDKN